MTGTVRSAALGVIAIVLAGACGSEPQGFRIELQFATDARHGCDDTQCAEYRFECGAKLGIRIEHLETGRVVSLCRDIRPLEAGDMCALLEQDLSLGQVTVGMSRLQVAVWNPAVLAEFGGECPDQDIVDLHPHGVPRVDFNPQPAFGGAIYFDVGTETVASVPLACTDPEQVDVDECPSTRINATAVSFDDGAALADVSELEVSFVRPRFVVDPDQIEPDALGPTGTWHFDDSYPMELEPATEPPTFTVTVPQLAAGFVCVEVHRVVGLNAPTVTCTPLSGEADTIAIDAWLLGADELGDVLDAARISNETFRENGLVVGRALSGNGPVGGATVSISSGTVSYLADPSGPPPGGPVETQDNGYFYSTDAPFGEGLWSASAPSPEQTASVGYAAGLIRGRVAAQIVHVDAQ